MTKKEFLTILGISMIFALRMVGVFMILPVLTIHAVSLQGVNGSLIGIAIGIYGLMQIMCQLPFGLMSDKIGCKSVIVGGLVLFILGSEIAATTNNIWGVITGRALQGSGAIGSVLIALLLDSVREQHHVKAMASVGMSVGIAFAASMVFGPIITDRFGLNGLFHSISILAILAIVLTYIIKPPISSHCAKNDENLFMIFDNIKQILTHSQLIKLNVSIFFIHTILMLNLIVLPKTMINLGFPLSIHWEIYSVIMLISSVAVVACIFYSEGKNYAKKILIACMSILFLSELIMFINISYYKMFLLGMQLFFIAFSIIETILPALINKEALKKYKGTTISIYSIGQFLGIGFGGIVGGFLLDMTGAWLVLFFSLIISFLCVIVSNTLH
ncbi:MFS transporter [Blochmannia endosymbiont of Camponotus sp. C-003]|uniref:MFS transporter n=1 Tax=unclassified Candidatus Blochmanniella TaxID=711328 RepID=UPI002023EBA8|nr:MULTISPECIES: MFS transporter [unclassified Candidatus Blochmannia]URJ23566.1 MFS transporter [Blochmannia endosymbiont of Camponotus sp. C-003]URJ29037.1 MFS transporter [Blochmannia endosymbiont of Camponotus sp. C-046]